MEKRKVGYPVSSQSESIEVKKRHRTTRGLGPNSYLNSEDSLSRGRLGEQQGGRKKNLRNRSLRYNNSKKVLACFDAGVQRSNDLYHAACCQERELGSRSGFGCDLCHRISTCFLPFAPCHATVSHL